MQTVDGWVTLANYEEHDLDLALSDCEENGSVSPSRVLEKYFDDIVGNLVDNVILELYPEDDEDKEIEFSWKIEGF